MGISLLLWGLLLPLGAVVKLGKLLRRVTGAVVAAVAAVAVGVGERGACRGGVKLQGSWCSA